jgi:hypothetical protein
MKTKLALTLTSSALIAGGNTDAGAAQPARSPAPANEPQAVRAAQLAAMNKAEVKKLLAQIAKAKAPEPKMGATCYVPAPTPGRMEYVCPTCGEKTLHGAETASRWTYELDACRRLFKELPKRDTMTLDESSFCRKCRPGTNAPSLNLVIRYNDRTTNAVSGIASQDLRLLKGLLSGDRSYRTSNDGQSPLKQQLPRLRLLLGIKDE